MDIQERIHKSRVLLRNPYAYLDGDGGFDAIPLPPVAAPDPPSVKGHRRSTDGGLKMPLISPDDLRGGRRKGARFSNVEVAAIARRLQAELWLHRNEIWPDREQLQPIDILDPSIALEAVGYSVRLHESLGQSGDGNERFEVAGLIDNSNGRVATSRRFPPEVRNFTAAHELGHAILHAGSGLHRDRPLDGTLARESDPTEIEANTFAAHFLLPEKQVRIEFEKRFLTSRFILDETTGFALARGGFSELENKCRTLRDLTRILARAEQYNGEYFHSLAQMFCVSVETMAIRLEELGLVEGSR